MSKLNNEAAHPNVETIFGQAIEMHCHRQMDVPEGWRPAFLDALVALNAVKCAKRDDLILLSPVVRHDGVHVQASGEDAVVDGICRKLRHRTRYTCEKCGRPGHARRLPLDVRVLCGFCAAPRVMKAKIEECMASLTLSAELGQDRLITFDEMPPQLRATVPAAAWQKVASGKYGQGTYCTTQSELRKLTGHWRHLLLALESVTADLE